ncbi:Type IV secretion system protein virB10 [Pelagimonas phthalicica]|jgi:type IV secretion system protein VirB10|uniref:Type IV secretion system protein virB10 n=1 Tax=Pelagimonas phthalicica TaxID=1037362 RepID=A0A238JJL6_9RHOB|nr:TrbI/VirB10 family protein [Pelagimonas phthalicica]MDP7151258.1 TrbI/VirB10 family protein [Paracoccaceae bacterium]TDS88746.1 type IV secretion system protein VirB10 [Pelagimonas phthalicica]SMX30357.1 Type IV secretion system protein virB10 [Pelagimonas phthalicica]
MADDPDLQKRLDTFKDGKTKPRSGGLGVGALAIALGLGGAGVAYWLATTTQDSPTPLETSEVTPFQDGRPGSGRLEFPPDETDRRVNDALIAVEEALEVPAAPAPEPSREVLDELARLREALAASQSERNAEIQAAVGDLREAFDAQTKALEAQIAERERELTALEREGDAKLSGLQSLLDAERAQREALEAELQQGALIADQRLLEERRRQEEEQRRREAERAASELLAAQIRSPAVVYSDGQANAASGTTTASTTGASAPLNENEAYLQTAARPLEIEEAARMEFPDRTLAQGSVIQAALQTAINSDLPGNVVAVVSEPVPAFSGDRILIPRGSRLFGQYRSGIEVGQKRILILWTRILTPDGISINIASVGADRLGRSGMTGLVDTKFLERFGGAALISIIGAAPSVAADRVSDETASDVLSDIGSDLSDATSSVIADQVSMSPTIYVDQGAGVTVLVDRDVVIYRDSGSH